MLADSDLEFAFLIEDDYVPAVSDFALAFLQRLSAGTGYVCQLARAVPDVFPRHAAMSNGAVSMDAARKALEVYGQIFSLFPFALDRFDYAVGCENQVTFLALLESVGYSVRDVADIASLPFFVIESGAVIECGKEGAPALLTPLDVTVGRTSGAQVIAANELGFFAQKMENEARRLRLRNGVLASETNALRTALGQMERTVERLQDERDRMIEKADQLQDERDRMIEKADQNSAELRQVAEDRVMYSQKLERIENSLSWKLTKPLRSLRRG